MSHNIIKQQHKMYVTIENTTYTTTLCDNATIEDGYYFMFYNSMNYIVHIEYNADLERKVVMPMFAHYTTQTKEIYREQWSWVRNMSFMELESSMELYKCDYLTEENVHNIDEDFRID